jgi:urea-proton symporter
MDYIIPSATVFLLVIMLAIFVTNKGVGATIKNFLFANQALPMLNSSLAIASHWFWAIAIFVGPAVAYNWGIIGLLTFAIPNGISCLIVGTLAHRIRDKYPSGFSLTAYIKENFSARVSALYQLEFVLISLAALLLSFTAVNKLWAFAGLATIVEPVYASLVIGLITLAFTLRGGIRTSIFTGSIQTVLWLGFIATMLFLIPGIPADTLTGKNVLTTLVNEKFLTTFAVAFVVSILVGASSHGMMWQKAFSMPRENIIPSFGMAGVIFTFMVIGLGVLSITAFGQGLEVKSADTAQMAAILSIAGVGGLVAFATILVGQASTVIDSSLNYIASLITLEWLKKDQVWVSRAIMVAFILLAWAISWAKLEIWTILMLMSAVRIVMFVPLVLHILRKKLNEQMIFYISIISVIISLYFAWTAKSTAQPIYDMYAALIALLLPLLVYSITGLLQKTAK